MKNDFRILILFCSNGIEPIFKNRKVVCSRGCASCENQPPFRRFIFTQGQQAVAATMQSEEDLLIYRTNLNAGWSFTNRIYTWGPVMLTRRSANITSDSHSLLKCFQMCRVLIKLDQIWARSAGPDVWDQLASQLTDYGSAYMCWNKWFNDVAGSQNSFRKLQQKHDVQFRTVLPQDFFSFVELVLEKLTVCQSLFLHVLSAVAGKPGRDNLLECGKHRSNV